MSKVLVFFKKIFAIKYLRVLLVISVLLNIIQFSSPKNQTTQAQNVEYNQDQKVTDIDNYLDQISPNFLADVQSLAKQYNIPSWGCGPSSYALAKIINHKFFSDNLRLSGTYDNNPYEIVQKFGLAGENNSKGIFIIQDHTWLEIYLRDKVLFVDPTDAQFGTINKIAYQLFEVGDPNMSQILKEKYNIVDDRISLLVQKTVNRVPASQPPYPGIIIPQQNLDYFLSVVDTRSLIINGQEPQQWDYWISDLIQKYE